jgi:hypothetical protein
VLLRGVVAALVPVIVAGLQQLRWLDQRDFVAWWDEHVGVRHGAGRGHKNNADLHSFSMEDAERLTGIKQPQVSRCRLPIVN